MVTAKSAPERPLSTGAMHGSTLGWAIVSGHYGHFKKQRLTNAFRLVV